MFLITNQRPLFYVESAFSFIPSTLSCSLSSWFSSSRTHHIIAVCLRSHYLSLPQSFAPDLKATSSTNPILHSLSGSIWTAFTEFGLGQDLLDTDVFFSFFFYI